MKHEAIKAQSSPNALSLIDCDYFIRPTIFCLSLYNINILKIDIVFLTAFFQGSQCSLLVIYLLCSL